MDTINVWPRSKWPVSSWDKIVPRKKITQPCDYARIGLSAMYTRALQARFSRASDRSERLGSWMEVRSECSTRCLQACLVYTLGVNRGLTSKYFWICLWRVIYRLLCVALSSFFWAAMVGETGLSQQVLGQVSRYPAWLGQVSYCRCVCSLGNGTGWVGWARRS